MFKRLFKKKTKETETKHEVKNETKVPKRRKSTTNSSIEKKIDKLSTKKDIENVLTEIIASRDAVLTEVSKIPDSVSNLMVDQITSPLKDFISAELTNNDDIKQLSINEAIKHEDVKQLSNNQAVKKGFDEVIMEMKEKIENLSQRHLKILNILVQNRGAWLDYEEVGKYCNPQLTGSCIRGYIADLINSYKMPINKKNFGRKSKIKLSNKAVKQLAITKLVD